MKSFTVKENYIGSAVSENLRYRQKEHTTLYIRIRIRDCLMLQFVDPRKNKILSKHKHKYTRERGNNGLFITLTPKVFLYRFLIRWLNNFGDF